MTHKYVRGLKFLTRPGLQNKTQTQVSREKTRTHLTWSHSLHSELFCACGVCALLLYVRHCRMTSVFAIDLKQKMSLIVLQLNVVWATTMKLLLAAFFHRN
jgi:hypothetical protein